MLRVYRFTKTYNVDVYISCTSKRPNEIHIGKYLYYKVYYNLRRSLSIYYIYYVYTERVIVSEREFDSK